MNVLVTGATGTVGAHVVRALGERGVATRVFVRDHDLAAASLGAGVELAVGDFADRSSLNDALDGVDRLFLACANVPDQIAHECAAIDAAAASGVERIVKLSVPSGFADSALVFARWHAEIERHLLAAGVPWVLLRPRPLMTNLLAFAETIGATGKLFAPAGDAEITYVDPRDIGAAAAVVLTGDGHEGRTYDLTGPEAITYERIAADLSAATGRQVDFVDVPDEAARQGMVDAGLPPILADFIVATFGVFRTGAMSQTTDAVRALTGREAGTFAQFARDHAALFGAPALATQHAS